MKRTLLLLAIVFALILEGGDSFAYAYTPPTQGTDNATDIIIWYGDNLTITGLDTSLSTIANALSQQGVPITFTNNISITDLEVSLIAASEVHAQVIADSNESIAMDFLSFLIIVAILAFTFWQKSILLYALSCPSSLVYGLSISASTTVSSARGVAGIVIAIIGTYCLYKAVMLGLEDIKQRTKK